MDSKHILVPLARALRETGLEAVMIGNAAAAIHGAPVTTIDIDFFIQKTPANVSKLKQLSKRLNAVVFTPFYPVSGLFRLYRDDDSLQLNFFTQAPELRSFSDVRNRAVLVDCDGEQLLAANPADTIMKLRELQQGLADQAEPPVEDTQCEGETRDLQSQILMLLSKPPEQRTHFLRRKIGLTGSCL